MMRKFLTDEVSFQLSSNFCEVIFQFFLVVFQFLKKDFKDSYLTNWLLSLEKLTDVTPLLCAFSNFLKHCPVDIFQTIIWPPSDPAANISLSREKPRHNTASSIIIKLSWNKLKMCFNCISISNSFPEQQNSPVPDISNLFWFSLSWSSTLQQIHRQILWRGTVRRVRRLPFRRETLPQTGSASPCESGTSRHLAHELQPCLGTNQSGCLECKQWFYKSLNIIQTIDGSLYERSLP